jgi:hypothetical protein
MSYGVNAPQGMQPYSFLDGSLYNGQLSAYNIASGYNNAIYTGDPVTLLADGTIGIGVAGSQIIGSFQGCKFYAADGTYTFSPYWTAALATQNAVLVEALVADAPGLIYNMQVSTHVDAGGNPEPAPTIAQDDINKNINFAIGAVTNFGGANVFTTPTNPGALADQTDAAEAAPNNPTGGNTRTGQSGAYLDYNTIGNGATLNFKIIGIVPQPGNVAGLIFNNARVIINANVYKSVGTAGV